MKRIFPHSVAALAAGLGLRLYFVLKHPGPSGDAPLYEQMAANWLQHHIYGMNVNDVVVPVDLRMPGYPAFLLVIYSLTRRVGEQARFFVMLAQIVVDLTGCLAVGGLAWLLGLLRPGQTRARPTFVVALWLAALCPFTANYVAVPMTEVFAGFFTTAALIALTGLIGHVRGGRTALFPNEWAARHAESLFALAGGFLIGLGTLFRPETPLLLVVALIVLAIVWLRRRRLLFGAQLCALLIVGCLLPLAPWAIRNALTLHEVQFLAPKNSNLPGELVPYGFMAWEKTWLFRVKDVYDVPWKLNGEVINLDEIPGRAFDTPEEKNRVAALLEQYNNDVTLSAEEDAQFGQLARERTARHPLRTYLWLPMARALTIWFTPRIELLPFSGQIFPVRAAWQEDPIDFSFTIGFFTLNLLYVAFALCGARRLWTEGAGLQIAVALLLGYVLLRTAFLTTLETPEPRYVLVCFPTLLALAAQIFAKAKTVDPTTTTEEAAATSLPTAPGGS